MKFLNINSPPKLSERKVYTGTYKGVHYEINSFPAPYHSSGIGWTHYLILNIDKQIPEELREKFWLTPQVEAWPSGTVWVRHDYYQEPLGSIEFHGGITYYSKEDGLEGGDRFIKIGCDYQHYLDEGQTYDLEFIVGEVTRSIESLIEICGGSMKARSSQDGKYYEIEKAEEPA